MIRGNSARWTELDYPLRDGEIGIESDTNKFKIGNGLDGWNDLSYFVDEGEVAAIVSAAIQAAGVGNQDPRIGVMAELTTTDQSTVVGAINEVNQPGDLTLLYANAKV